MRKTTYNQSLTTWMQVPRKVTTSWVVLIVAALLAAVSCGDEVPLDQTLNARVNYFSNDSTAVSKLIQAIDAENERVDAAMFTLQNQQLKDALLRAKERGAQVRLVFDEDNQNEQAIQELLKANVDCKFVDGEIKYLPDPNLTGILPEGYIVRPGNLSDMSHNFFLLGKTDVWNFSSPFLSKNVKQIGYHVVSELLSEDFTREFKQLHSNVSATSLDVYGGPTKSSVHKHPYETDDEVPFYYSDSLYTDQGRLRLIFSPQNGAIKTLIDEIYRAKGSIYIQSQSVDDENVIKALKSKKKRGFSVKVVVNRNAQVPRTAGELRGLEAKAVDVDFLPTVIIFDQEPGVGDKYNYPRQALIMSHEILSASPLSITRSKPDDTIEQRKSDYYSDGSSWMVSEVIGGQGKIEIINNLLSQFETIYKSSGAKPL